MIIPACFLFSELGKQIGNTAMIPEESKILIIDDDKDILFATEMVFKKHFSVVKTANNPLAISELMKKNQFDVFLLDMNFRKDDQSGREGFYWLKEILDADPKAAVILMTAYGDVDKAVRAIREGATDFILKPWQNEKLITTISTALKLRNTIKEADKLLTQRNVISADIDREFHDIIGSSETMQEVFEIINKVARTEANVLILGENGTGKELIARALHRRSNRADKVFLNVDMGAIAENLFESELFGHIKGAFTDAKENRMGRFELAAGGSLFLDEIGNLPLHLQSKILAALQNREITPVGSNKIIPIDIRLICATNQSLFKMIQDKEFREDLLYRINTVEIKLPPLRDRVEDISPLADFFLKKYARKYQKQNVRFSADSIKKLENYPWPGNIRELQHVIERTIIMINTDTIKSEDIYISGENTEKDKDEITGSHNLEEMEEIIIKKVIKSHQGNISKAAQELGLTRASLYRRLEKYGI